MRKHSNPPAEPARTAKGRRKKSSPRPKVVFTEGRIRKRVQELAERINKDYRGKTLHVVGVLEDGFMFMADLVRALKVPVICYFVRPQIRDSSAGSVAMREISYVPGVDAAGKDILLVDGILQSGLTLDHLYRYLLGQEPASLRTATLLEKPAERKLEVATDYVAFRSKEKFLVGYGLDDEERYRNLPYIARLARGSKV
jgi:hypoxanthine phosphoribosyltransferase